MAFLEFDNISIAALAGAVPAHVQTLEEAARHNPDYVRFFQRQTGVLQRHISLIEQTSVDLGYAAALKALEKAGWDAHSLDALIFLSQTPDFNAGTGNAFIAHYMLGLREDVPAFDIPLACSSFPYGLSVCSALLQQAAINRVLMLSGDTQWHFYENGVPTATADGAFLFGEATTALLLERRPDSSPLRIALHTDGSGYKYLFNPLGGARNAWRRAQKFLLPNGDTYSPFGRFGYMDGLEITSFSTTKVVGSIRDFLDRQKQTLVDYDGLVLHQANMQIVTTIARRLKIDMAKVPVTLDRYGNVSGASTSLTIVDAYAGSQQDKLSLLTCAFGTGLSWGIAAIEIYPARIEPVFPYEGRFEEGYVRPAP
jgi:3-oxoacyl-[acyl-carrier-protein] synthase-3